jgi:hypothetical protein
MSMSAPDTRHLRVELAIEGELAEGTADERLARDQDPAHVDAVTPRLGVLGGWHAKPRRRARDAGLGAHQGQHIPGLEHSVLGRHEDVRSALHA